ncbi:Fc.00g094840.m01.CDS01 [Cosmosporella sp. VM-42]
MALTDIIQSIVSAVSNLAPFHLLSFSALLGTELYQTFIITKVAFNELPRTAFTTLQKRLFPIYFQGQTLLLFLSAVTFPPNGPFSLVQHKGDWIPFAVAGVTSVLNLVLYGPRTRQTMIDRIHQATRDARKPGDSSELSPEMAGINRRFKRNHAMSIHLNLITIGATLWHGWRLASRLQF